MVYCEHCGGPTGKRAVRPDRGPGKGKRLCRTCAGVCARDNRLPTRTRAAALRLAARHFHTLDDEVTDPVTGHWSRACTAPGCTAEVWEKGGIISGAAPLVDCDRGNPLQFYLFDDEREE